MKNNLKNHPPNFNPHSREGSDHICAKILHRSANFNPHSREGSDGKRNLCRPYDTISIHTPAKGVTGTLDKKRVNKEFEEELRLLNIISIHTPAKGVT